MNRRRVGAMDNAPVKRHKNLILCLILIAATVAVYRPVKDHEFVNMDDSVYVLDNPHVRTGLSREGLIWSLTSIYAANWHPLTWISHMLDCELYGLNPSGHHLTNLLFHMGSTLLLFLSLIRMTGARWRSFLVAALFALHPLHVESVAWVSERKDVLCGFFWMAALWAYARYTARPSLFRYCLVFFLFLLGLMSKPMIVTLPFVLLLLDWWPLNRSRAWKRALLEKTPMFILSAAASTITYIAQDAAAALSYQIPFHLRAANSLVSYVTYMQKMFLPHSLSFFYPHPMDSLSLLGSLGALLLLVLITLLSVRFSSKAPYFPVGWLWYLGTMVPVIGLIQVGSQGMADRYTYIPLIGLFLVLSWGSAQIVARFRSLLPATSLFWTSSVVILSILSFGQLKYWKNSVALCRQAIGLCPSNFVAHYNLASVLLKEGRLREAEEHLLAAMVVRHGDPLILNNLANALARQGRIEEAVIHYREALRINPGFREAQTNLELALRLLSQGNGPAGGKEKES